MEYISLEEEEEREREVDEGERTGGVQEVECVGWFALGTFGIAPRWYGGKEEKDGLEIGAFGTLGIL